MSVVIDTPIEAPITPIQWDELEEQFNDDDKIVAHLYYPGKQISLCKITADQDPHSNMHARQDWPGPGSSCPACQAIVCTECDRVATERFGWMFGEGEKPNA